MMFTDKITKLTDKITAILNDIHSSRSRYRSVDDGESGSPTEARRLLPVRPVQVATGATVTCST